MVLSFFRRGEPPLEQIERQIVEMLGDARHSFDLAMTSLLATDEGPVDAEVYRTDQRINDAERQIRRELVVHSAVQGTQNLATVLAHLLLIKKIERIGDQAKNIMDLRSEGVALSGAADADDLRQARNDVSDAYADLLRIIGNNEHERVEDYRTRVDELVADYEQALRDLIHSDQPASEAVPRALLYRYLKRIAANLAGIASTLTDPLDQIDYRDGDDTED
ncbi:MAG: phosphate uptake regulator PhoU [Actinomycetia bacterium]|nr:phosphate uptake regulator PhoU [Actinomycetes bacterium]